MNLCKVDVINAAAFPPKAEPSPQSVKAESSEGPQRALRLEPVKSDAWSNKSGAGHGGGIMLELDLRAASSGGDRDSKPGPSMISNKTSHLGPDDRTAAGSAAVNSGEGGGTAGKRRLEVDEAPGGQDQSKRARMDPDDKGSLGAPLPVGDSGGASHSGDGGVAPGGTVQYRFLYDNGRRMAGQIEAAFSCCFCPMRCRHWKVGQWLQETLQITPHYRT